MKFLLLFATAALLSATAFGVEPNKDTLDKIHSLTSSDGKKIKAQIVHIGDSEVKIRKGRKDFEVPLSKFSKETQLYLKKWAEENAVFDFTVIRKPVKLTSIGKLATHGYSVTLENRSPMTAKGLRVVYRLYNSQGEMFTKKLKVGEIKPREDFEFKTVSGAQTFGGRLYIGGEDGLYGPSGHNLSGLWIRIYDAEGKKIFEDKDDDAKIKAEWPE